MGKNDIILQFPPIHVLNDHSILLVAKLRVLESFIKSMSTRMNVFMKKNSQSTQHWGELCAKLMLVRENVHFGRGMHQNNAYF